MKHVKALSKLSPKKAFSLDGKSGKVSKTECDSILKTPEEKEEKKGSNQS
jgi:hypothetical protein